MNACAEPAGPGDSGDFTPLPFQTWWISSFVFYREEKGSLGGMTGDMGVEPGRAGQGEDANQG